MQSLRNSAPVALDIVAGTVADSADTAGSESTACCWLYTGNGSAHCTPRWS